MKPHRISKERYAQFKDFIESTNKHFRFLTTDYDFRYMKTAIARLECVIIYQNQTTEISVFYELFIPPIVWIGKLDNSKLLPIVDTWINDPSALS
jgi:hypothetical protein